MQISCILEQSNPEAPPALYLDATVFEEFDRLFNLWREFNDGKLMHVIQTTIDLQPFEGKNCIAFDVCSEAFNSVTAPLVELTHNIPEPRGFDTVKFIKPQMRTARMWQEISARHHTLSDIQESAKFILQSLEEFEFSERIMDRVTLEFCQAIKELKQRELDNKLVNNRRSILPVKPRKPINGAHWKQGGSTPDDDRNYQNRIETYEAEYAEWEKQVSDVGNRAQEGVSNDVRAHKPRFIFAVNHHDTDCRDLAVAINNVICDANDKRSQNQVAIDFFESKTVQEAKKILNRIRKYEKDKAVKIAG